MGASHRLMNNNECLRCLLDYKSLVFLSRYECGLLPPPPNRCELSTPLMISKNSSRQNFGEGVAFLNPGMASAEEFSLRG